MSIDTTQTTDEKVQEYIGADIERQIDILDEMTDNEVHIFLDIVCQKIEKESIEIENPKRFITSMW